MNNHHFPIPAGLRPLKIVRVEEDVLPVSTAAAASQSPPSKEHTPKFLAVSRDYYLSVARKMRQSGATQLPAPRPRCCCFRAPKVKHERSASGLELSRLLQGRDDTWM